MTKKKYQVGDHVEVIDTKERGTIIHVPRDDSALRSCVVVCFGREGIMMHLDDLKPVVRK